MSDLSVRLFCVGTKCVHILRQLCIFSTIKLISYLVLYVVSRLCCIAPVLAAKVLPGVDVTVGHEEEEGGKWPYAGTAQAITALGAKHTIKEVTISFLYRVRLLFFVTWVNVWRAFRSFGFPYG